MIGRKALVGYIAVKREASHAIAPIHSLLKKTFNLTSIMMSKLRIATLTLVLSAGLTLSSFVLTGFSNENPASITRSTTIGGTGKEVVKTEILLDKTTTREDLIHTCKFLAEEEVQLTFESLNIRKAFFGIVGKPRIAYAKGKIELPDGSVEQFEAGGAISFQSIKITYLKSKKTNNYSLNMVEIVD